MAGVSQKTEIEPSCDVSIAINLDRTSMEQKILRVPHQLLEGMTGVCQLAKTETSCHVSIAIENDRTSIEQKLKLPWTTPKKKILRVPHQLLKVNEKAYEPCVISIGPYHRGKDHLKEMEGLKVHSLNELLRMANQKVEIYISEIEKVVEETRNCYSEPLGISKEEFAEMMVLDGCFIILFFLTEIWTKISCCYGDVIRTSILHDLVLVENQLPFSAIFKLLDFIPKTVFNLGFSDPKVEFISRILKEFEGYMPGLRVDRVYDVDMKNVKHIVHLLHSNWLPSENNKQINNGEWNFIRSATELREAGIQFQMVEKKGDVKRSLFDIKFKNGILEMPQLTIEDNTESLYRNLIACEQFDYEGSMFLINYVALMNSLINKGKDVGLLCKSKIIDNLLGDDESVATLFNRLGEHCNLDRNGFFYAQLFKDINDHCERPWNTWKAYLRHKYFNTPWAIISFLAATLLILLTVLQTTFTIFPRS